MNSLSFRANLSFTLRSVETCTLIDVVRFRSGLVLPSGHTLRMYIEPGNQSEAVIIESPIGPPTGVLAATLLAQDWLAAH